MEACSKTHEGLSDARSTESTNSTAGGSFELPAQRRLGMLPRQFPVPDVSMRHERQNSHTTRHSGGLTVVAALCCTLLAGCASSTAGTGGAEAVQAPQPAAQTPQPAPRSPQGATNGTGPSSAGSSGAFSAPQADRGRAVFTETCSECHFTSEMRNAQFQFTWKRRTAWDLHRLIVRDMPEDAPGSLTNKQYIDVTAYILQLNGHPTGDAELVRDEATLQAIPVKKPAGTLP